ncbi:MAG: aspartate carbamoyltransferase regulatory subunit [Evtepia sp.]
MIVGTIVDGVVIDHIPAGHGMDLYRDLHLDHLDCEVALIKNAASGKYGKKDIIKINADIDINYEILGFFDPNITVNRIRDGKLCAKEHPPLPNVLNNIIYCKNPRCITTTEQELPHIFKLTDRETATYRCIYCETKAERLAPRRNPNDQAYH